MPPLLLLGCLGNNPVYVAATLELFGKSWRPFPSRLVALLALLPGQFVKAQVQAGQQRAWLVPQAAVSSSDQGKSVWTVQDGKATPTPVQVAGWVGGDWAVTQGLKDGDQVIVDNLMKLQPGAPVQPRQAAAPAAASAPPAAASR